MARGVRGARRAGGVVAGAVVVSGLLFVPAAGAAGPAGGGVAADGTCWATHYGEGIPPGSFTASGDVFDPDALAAATSLGLDPQLPFGTMVKVTNTANGASVTV